MAFWFSYIGIRIPTNWPSPIKVKGMDRYLTPKKRMIKRIVSNHSSRSLQFTSGERDLFGT